MKEVFGTLGNEVIRPWATLILPGCLAITPFFVFFCVQYTPFRQLVASNAGETITGFIATSLFVGFVLEDIGSIIESRWDNKRERQAATAPGDTHEGRWSRYLQLTFEREPVGHRYLRTIVMRMKFELGTVAATPFGLIGLWMLWAVCGESGLIFPALTAVLLVLGSFAYWSAGKSHELLDRIRKIVLEGASRASERTLS